MERLSRRRLLQLHPLPLSGGGHKEQPRLRHGFSGFYDRYDKEYYDENLSAGTWYYALKVTNEGGFSTWSNEAGVTVGAEAIRKFDK